MREPSASAAAAAEILDRLGGRWALVGALAALRYRATPRLTTDVDILAEWCGDLVGAFEDAGYDVKALADPDEAPHLLLVRGHGDQIESSSPSSPTRRWRSSGPMTMSSPSRT